MNFTQLSHTIIGWRLSSCFELDKRSPKNPTVSVLCTPSPFKQQHRRDTLFPQKLDLVTTQYVKMVSTEDFDALTRTKTLNSRTVEWPVLCAARNPDPKDLTACLDRYEQWPEDNSPRFPEREWFSPSAFFYDACNMPMKTPLIEAIKAQLPENVRILLDRGADPNGVPLYIMQEFATKFFRFEDDAESLNWYPFSPNSRNRLPLTTPKHPSRPQTVELIGEELKGRMEKFSCFWRGHDCMPTDFYEGTEGMTPIEEACKHDSAIVLDMMLKTKADTSCWKGAQKLIPDPYDNDFHYEDSEFWQRAREVVPDPPTHSSLSISNPILCTIKFRHMHHLTRLLDEGFNPNAMPLAIRQQCYPPLMACFILCNPPNWDAFSKLLESRTEKTETNRNILTPLYRIHTLHIIAALQSLPILQRVLGHGFDLASAGRTAVGHTLLHIACLPLDITQINVFEEIIYKSSHEFRSLFMQAKHQGHIIFEHDFPRPQTTDFFDAQTELVLFLLSQSKDPYADLIARDTHGNTAFHYLAMYRIVNLKLLEKMMAFAPEKSAKTFNRMPNFGGWSAAEMMRRGLVAQVSTRKPFWRRSCAARYTDDGKLEIYE
jgi:ankyrin repeat protein